MSVHVEFYGIPRRRAGVAAVDVAHGRQWLMLAELLAELAEQFPELSADCLDSGRLREGVLANLNGERFVCEPEELVQAGDCVLLLSADAGG